MPLFIRSSWCIVTHLISSGTPSTWMVIILIFAINNFYRSHSFLGSSFGCGCGCGCVSDSCSCSLSVSHHVCDSYASACIIHVHSMRDTQLSLGNSMRNQLWHSDQFGYSVRCGISYKWFTECIHEATIPWPGYILFPFRFWHITELFTLIRW